MAKTAFLDFEQPIAELEAKIDELRFVQDDSAVDISEEIERLQQKSDGLLKEIYAKLSPWQVSQLARHPQRPYTLDYVNDIFTDFHELHGDRSFSDDLSIVGGMARFNGQAVMVLGHQKGRDTKERALRNFGMSKPEGYRKALRLMKLAEKFGLPLFTFVDTPGAYPGIDAEERGQSEAIGHNLYEMSQLKVPVITTIIGEGGSGGALAIAVGDTVLMLAVRDLLGDLARRVRVDPVEKRRQSARCGRSARSHRASTKSAWRDRQDHRRAPWRRASRPDADGGDAEARAGGQSAAVSGDENQGPAGGTPRAAVGIWQVQEHGRRKLIRSSSSCSTSCALR